MNDVFLRLIFYIAEIIIGIPCGIIMFKNKFLEDEAKIGRNNMISNIFFFIICGVAIAGCVVLQIKLKEWWHIFFLFTTGLLSCYILYGIIMGLHNSLWGKGNKKAQ